MSEPTTEPTTEPVSEQPGDEMAPDVVAGVTDEPAGTLTVEDDPQGTTDPAELAGSGDAGDDAVE